MRNEAEKECVGGFIWLYIWNKHNVVNRLLLFSHTVVSDTAIPRTAACQLPCPSPSSPWDYSNASPLSWWWHPTISSSVVPFSSRPQSFPLSGSLQTRGLFYLRRELEQPAGEGVFQQPWKKTWGLNTQMWVKEDGSFNVKMKEEQGCIDSLWQEDWEVRLKM